MNFKPQLASDAVIEQVNFPTILQPKTDGVRGLNQHGKFTGRSMDEFEGYGISKYFGRPELHGYDGEVTLGNKPNCTDRLCSKTSGAMGRFKGVTEMADLHWWLFDVLTEKTLTMPYEERYARLKRLHCELGDPRIHLVPAVTVHTQTEMSEQIAAYFDAGYEGAIIRNPAALYKPGRPSKKQELWRVKPWADAEILVTGITEGFRNENEAKTNTLGRTERSSSQKSMVPNGEVGSIQGVMLADFFCPVTGKILFPKNLPVTVSSGKMTVKEASYYFKNQSEILGHVVKFSFMTHGTKDLPRFPGYMSHRLPEDMSNDSNS